MIIISETEVILIRELDIGKQICPLCGSRQINKSGKRHSRFSISQRYECKICGTSFCASVHGYFKSKYPLYVKQFAIEMYLNGLSLRRVQDKLQEDLGVVVSHQSVRNWLVNAGVDRRPQSSGDQQNRIKRSLIEVGVSTIVRFSTSDLPGKMIIIVNTFPLQSSLLKEDRE